MKEGLTRARRAAIAANVMATAVEALAFASSTAALASTTRLGQLAVLLASAGMLILTVRATPHPRWIVALVGLALAGATAVMIGGQHRKVDLVGFVGALVTGVATWREARRRDGLPR